MLKNNLSELKNKTRFIGFAILICTFIFAVGCRYDMQDQPRYKVYKQSDFFSDKRSSRDLPEGTVPRGYLRENKAFYTGKKRKCRSERANSNYNGFDRKYACFQFSE